MIPRVALVLPAWLAVVSICAGGTPTSRYVIACQVSERDCRYLAVAKGRLVVGKGSDADTDKDAPHRWYILGTKIKSSVGGGYLAFDPTGKDNRVFLTPEPGEGTEWSMSLRKRSPGDVEHGAVRVGTGPLRGRYLDVEEVEKDGRKFWRLIVTKKPRRKVEASRIYIHR